MSKIDKKVFSQFAEFECKRQLVLNLSEEENIFLGNGYQIKRKEYFVRSVKPSLKIGKDYEQKIYHALLQMGDTKASRTESNEISKTVLMKDNFDSLYTEIKNLKSNKLCLLECEFEIPVNFLSNFLDDHQRKLFSTSICRPDVIIFEKEIIQHAENKIYEIMPNGSKRAIETKDDFKRIGINVFDIKASNYLMINNKHFIEVIFYGVALSNFLYEHNLNDKFFVKAEENGILPTVTPLKFESINDFKDKAVTLIWDSCYRLFKDVFNQINALFEQMPINISPDVPDYNFSQGCSRCKYIDDCKKNFGFFDLPSKDWDVRLLSNLSQAVAEQLRNMGVRTMSDAQKVLNQYVIGKTPNPIYPHLPLMKVKLEAILNNIAFYPNQNDVYSLAIPKYSDFVLIIDSEYDPLRERVFTIGIYLNLTVRQKKFGCYKSKFDYWWQVWSDYLENSISLNEIKMRLESSYNLEIDENDIRIFKMIVDELWSKSESSDINLTLANQANNFTSVKYWCNFLNQGVTDIDEANLTKQLLKTLHLLVSFCNIMEKYIRSEPDERNQTQKPNMAIFYWSTNQLKFLEDLIERHLQFVLLDNQVKPLLLELSAFISPSESDVKDPFQHKKLYDLCVFTETIVGLPNTVVNYTWHETAKELFNSKSNRMFWIPHINYMDFGAWDEFLAEEDIEAKQEKKHEISRQIRHKLRTLDKLRNYFQLKVGTLVSQNTTPVNSTTMLSTRYENNFHLIGNFWYIYSRLNSAISEYEAEYYRTMFPLFSIAKLQSAEVINLSSNEIQTRNSSKYSYEFELHNLSTNVKFKEGDHVLLVPFELRDGIYPRDWEIIIEEMNWKKKQNSEISYYEIKTNESYGNLIEKAQEKLGFQPKSWYLYPKAGDNWPNKLWNMRNNTGLLTRNNFGTSWLAQRLTYLWELSMGDELDYPMVSTFRTPELYLYMPEILQQTKTLEPPELLTNVKNKPDSSQELAIKTSLENIISMIIGPPGTGKTETIVSLIDEFLIRNSNRPVKILISAFSYPALNVVLEKLQKSIDTEDKPTQAASIQKIFLHSSSHEPNELIINDVNILNLYKDNSSWKINEQSYKRMKRSSQTLINESFILFGNAHQLYHLTELNDYAEGNNFEVDFNEFDLIIVDEASQYPTDYFMSCLQFVKNHSVSFRDKSGIPINKSREDPLKIAMEMTPDTNIEENCLTKVVVVGDHNQLPPVRIIDPPKKLEIALGSLFNYYFTGHQLSAIQLENNYRSNQDIVDYTASLGFYKNLKAHHNNANNKIKGDLNNIIKDWVKEALDPNKIICSIVHKNNLDTTISELETKIVSDLIIGYYTMSNPKTIDEQKRFWEEEIGIVAPHNAQGRMIINNIFENIVKEERNCLTEDELMRSLKSAIVSVEKFQGSDRQIIIASMGISDKDQLKAEEEFIYDLNRFNVLTSRAKSKAILVCSKNYLDYLPKKNQIIENAEKIRKFTHNFCNNYKAMIVLNEPITFRWK